MCKVFSIFHISYSRNISADNLIFLSMSNDEYKNEEPPDRIIDAGLNIKEEQENSELYKICSEVVTSVSGSNSLEIASSLAKFGQFLSKLTPDRYTGILSMDIPNLFISLFLNSNQVNVVRPLTLCISLLYEKDFSTREVFESDDFIRILIDNNPISLLTDFKMLILFKFLSSTQNEELSLHVFNIFALDDIKRILNSTSNEQTINAIFRIIQLLCVHINDPVDASTVLKLIASHIGRGIQRCIIPMLSILENLIQRDMLNPEEIKQNGLDSKVCDLIAIPKEGVNTKAAQVLIEYAEHYKTVLYIDYRLFMEKLTTDPENQSLIEEEDRRKRVFAKLFMEHALYDDNFIANLFSNGIIEYFYAELDNFSSSIKSYIIVVLCQTLFRASIENIKALLPIVQKLDISLLYPIEIGINLNVDFVVIASLKAILNLLNLIDQDNEYGKYLQQHFFNEIEKSEIEAFQDSDDDSICDLANSILSDPHLSPGEDVNI